MLVTNYQLKKKQSVASQTLDDFKGLSSTQLQTNLNNIKAQNDSLTEVYVNSPLVTPILDGVGHAVVEDMWLTKVVYTTPFPANRPGEGNLLVEGTIHSEKDGSEDLIIGGKFKESMANQPALKRLCRNVNIRYTSIANSGARGKVQKTNNETKFVLTCSNESKGRGR